MNKHYDKYKETIKKVARRHRLLMSKDKWIADYLMSNSCSHCGESELICLQFYPDDRKIRALSKKSEDKTEVLEYISNNEIVCRNCFQKRKFSQTSLPVSIILSYDWCPFSSILVNHTTNVLLF